MSEPLTKPQEEFDPLREFYGMWNTELAEQYLPLPRVHAAKYECLGGYLVMSPYERASSSRAEGELYTLLRGPARDRGLVSYLAINMQLCADTWIEPDLAVLRESAGDAVWVPAEQVLMPVEFVSASSRRRDRIDKPRLCAEAGVPWYLRVELDHRRWSVFVGLDRLEGDAYVEYAAACEGQRFVVSEPLALDFDPAVLLEP